MRETGETGEIVTNPITHKELDPENNPSDRVRDDHRQSISVEPIQFMLT